MNYRETKEYLFNLRGGGSKYGIDRMRLLVEKLGHPERKLRVIHVAGTNGKGSVCAMAESIYRAAGFKTGLFTSPHLVRLGERVRVNNVLLTEDRIVRLTRQLRDVSQEITRAGSPEDHPTFFEFITAMGFLHFVENSVDVAVFETGLGGRLDATNVVEPAVTVITSIGLDHCEMLGHTHAAIAREKAGILKPGKPLVLGRVNDESRAVIEEVAREREVPVIRVDDVFGEGEGRRPWPETSLEGEHQRLNAAAAVLAVERLAGELPVTPEQAAAGLARVEWPGRWQRLVLGGVNHIFEAAHNPEGAEVLDAQLSRLTAAGIRPIVAAGALGDDRARALFSVIGRHAAEVVLFMPNQKRATSFEVMKSFLPPDFQGPVRFGRVREEFSPAGFHRARPGETVVVTGSIYLIGEVMEALEGVETGEETLQ